MDTSTIAQFQDKCNDWVNPKSEVRIIYIFKTVNLGRLNHDLNRIYRVDKYDKNMIDLKNSRI